ncbi:MAG: Pvc16 family protein [Acidimicrobiales bacterium]
MIDEIDRALEAWLKSVLKPTQVDITFRAPPEQPNQRRPLVAAALYDIVEEESTRSNYVEDIRDDHGRVVARQGAPRRFVLSYQLSVVVADAAIEHQLLGRILKGGVDTDSLPGDDLPDDLRAAGLTVPLQVAKTRPAGATIPETMRVGEPGWRTTIDLTLVVPVLPDPITEIAPPAEILDLGVSREGGKGKPPSAATPDEARKVPLEDRKWTSVRRREPT